MTPLAASSLPVVDAVPHCGSTSTGRAKSIATLFHFSLNVSDLDRSIAFYEVLFGTPPAKRYRDYAKFELVEPPLVFSLVPNPPASGGSLSHFGFPVENIEDLQAAAARLAAAGLEIRCQEDTVCGYARQDKVWIADPDQNFWEIYVVHEEVDPESVRSSYDGAPPNSLVSLAVPQAAPVELATIWEHRVLMPLPDRIPHDDATVHEVRLEGLFNDRFSLDERRHLLNESLRVLGTGGRLQVHGLVADRPLPDGPPSLPGVASLVSRVPIGSEPLDELAAAGFERIAITKLPEGAAFEHGDCQMREIKIEAYKPSPPVPGGETQCVLYKGPFASVVDEEGRLFRRGHRTEVSLQTWERLGRSSAASQFVFFNDPQRDDRACG
jgi:catechol 2,3-dioxygenase-like lactoylglutathione lyase family enzyme